MNITYKCNNGCIFCISNTTKRKLFDLEKPLKMIMQVDKEYNFTEQDIFIVNGGEPTLSDDFVEIINFLNKKRMKIIVYSNGRKLKETSIRNIITSTNIRWIIPFYGLQKTNDYYTNVDGSFKDTYEAISTIPETHRNKISLKLLVKEKKQIKEFIRLIELLDWKSEIHISLILDDNIQERIKLAKKLKRILFFLFSKQLKIKISNVPICCLPQKMKKILNYYNKMKEKGIKKYYFIDYNKIYPINYDKNHVWMEKCKKCRHIHYCVDNGKKYRALNFNKDEIFLDLE